MAQIRNDRCLPASRWGVECGACLAVCPVHALSFSNKQISVSGRCFACGRCAAACPTGALTVDGFARIAEEVSVVEGSAVHLECERVSRKDAVPGATRVPCLGGLGTDVLMELAAGTNGSAIRLMDRGWCTGCPAGGAGFSLDEVIAPARAVLTAVGCAPVLLPAIERRPLPEVHRNDRPRASSTLSRRALFRQMSKHVPARRDADDPRFPPAARRLMEEGLIHRLAERNGRKSPAVFPRASISKSCSDHRICAAACPTGALAVYEQDSTRGVVYTPGRCLACGRCEDVCPTDSIHVAPTGGSSARIALTAFMLSVCSECEDEFADRDGAGICPACGKERSILSNPLTPRLSIQDIEESAP